MSDLTSIEKLRLQRFFGMGSGYVLDFSNRTFSEFILENARLDIYSEKYNQGSGSKAHRLRAFWDKESNYTTGKLISAILEYWRTHNELNQRTVSEQDKQAYEECLKIANRLKQDNPVENIEALQPNSDDKDFDLLAQSIRETIEKNQPETALDRLHTFVVKYIRQLCDKHTILYSKDEPLHSIFGKYVKFVVANNLIDTVMAERILKSAISVLESFNDVRNNKSFAHDNPILNYNESIFIFNSITNAIKFIEIIEDKFDETTKQTAKANIDDLPF